MAQSENTNCNLRLYARREAGWLTDLSNKEEFLCLIASLYGRKSINIKSGPRYFGSPDATSRPLRCAYYAGNASLSEKEMQAAHDRDGSAFVLAVLRNTSVMVNSKRRAQIEEFISGRLIQDYKRRCEQLNMSLLGFDPMPVSGSGREVLEHVNLANKSSSQLEKLAVQSGQVSSRLDRFERAATWAFFVILIAIYLSTKR